MPRRTAARIEDRLQGSEGLSLVEGITLAGAVRLRYRQVEQELLVWPVVGAGTKADLHPNPIHPAEREQPARGIGRMTGHVLRLGPGDTQVNPPTGRRSPVRSRNGIGASL